MSSSLLILAVVVVAASVEFVAVLLYTRICFKITCARRQELCSKEVEPYRAMGEFEFLVTFLLLLDDVDPVFFVTSAVVSLFISIAEWICNVNTEPHMKVVVTVRIATR